MVKLAGSHAATVCLLWASIVSVSQSVAQEKEVSRAMALYGRGDLEGAVKVMHKTANKYNQNELWDILVKLEMEKCEAQWNDPGRALSMMVTRLIADAVDSIAGIAPSELDEKVRGNRVIYGDCLLACNEAALKSTSATASMLERILSVDTNPDSVVSEEALQSFTKAEAYFARHDYLPAKNLYLKALSQHPGYYQAALYAGDMYWHLNELDSAIHYLSKCTRWQPHLLEPRVYMIDALASNHEDKKAIDECINALTVYPSESVFLKLRDLLDRNGMELNRQRLLRGAMVNIPPGYSLPPVKFSKPSLIWSAYSRSVGAAGFSRYGIHTGLTGDVYHDYLELYAWKRMMAENPDAPELAEARAMEKEGVLDCYIMITQFHRDFYEQYHHFMSHHRERVIQFCRNHLVKVK